MAERHNVFLSFHHASDEYFKNYFETQFSEIYDGFISKAVSDGDINTQLKTETIRQKIRDEFIRDATVTIVLIGENTWKRKHIDWEISSSIRDTTNNSRTGLIGILLPTYRCESSYNSLSGIRGFNGFEEASNGGSFNPYTIPPRLYDNVKCGFAKIYSWEDSSRAIQEWIHEAFQRRKVVTPDNSFPSYANNRSDSQNKWSY